MPAKLLSWHKPSIKTFAQSIYATQPIPSGHSIFVSDLMTWWHVPPRSHGGGVRRRRRRGKNMHKTTTPTHKHAYNNDGAFIKKYNWFFIPFIQSLLLSLKCTSVRFTEPGQWWTAVSAESPAACTFVHQVAVVTHHGE